MKKDGLTLVVPLDLGVSGYDGTNHASLCLVGLVVGFGVCRRSHLECRS